MAPITVYTNCYLQLFLPSFHLDFRKLSPGSVRIDSCCATSSAATWFHSHHTTPRRQLCHRHRLEVAVLNSSHKASSLPLEWIQSSLYCKPLSYKQLQLFHPASQKNTTVPSSLHQISNMYNPGMYQQAAVSPANAVYQQHTMPSTSSFPADMQVHMNSQQPSMPNTSSNPDMSGHAADASVDTNDQDDEEGAGKRRRVQRACDVSSP